MISMAVLTLAYAVRIERLFSNAWNDLPTFSRTFLKGFPVLNLAYVRFKVPFSQGPVRSNAYSASNCVAVGGEK
jgi:hypothetical protein